MYIIEIFWFNFSYQNILVSDRRRLTAKKTKIHNSANVYHKLICKQLILLDKLFKPFKTIFQK